MISLSSASNRLIQQIAVQVVYALGAFLLALAALALARSLTTRFLVVS